MRGPSADHALFQRGAAHALVTDVNWPLLGDRMAIRYYKERHGASDE
jgi:glycerate kinase